MKTRMFHGAMGAFLILGAFVLAGCNIFGWTHGDDDSSDYLSEGREFMNEAKYEEAADQFQKAVDTNPTDAEARYLHAKAMVLGSGVSITQLADQMTSGDPGELPLFSPDPALSVQEDNAGKTKLYQASYYAALDLKEIHEGRAVGKYGPGDIDVDYAIATGVSGVLGLRDTNQDRVIDENDFVLDISRLTSGEDLKIEGIEDLVASFFEGGTLPIGKTAKTAQEELIGADKINPLLAFVTGLILTSGDLLTEIVDRIVPGEEGEGLDTEEIEAYVEDFLAVVGMYWYDDGRDNDGDGGIDEEIINGIDDDGDGRIDEDTNHYDGTPINGTAYPPDATPNVRQNVLDDEGNPLPDEPTAQ
ncbi:MAG: hypothetical protein KAQ78_00270 [Candidatus Latescibacteria bacterium]|nr:hypothetical protein [Candidatus Latescibacterota bacterium]